MDASQLTPEQRKELEEKIKSMSPEQLAALQKQQCIFCQMISGKIPAKRVYEDDRTIVILDINPAAKGHLLLVPKEHYAIMPQVKEADLSHFIVLAKLLSQVLLRTLRSTGTNIFVANGLAAGQRSAHFLIHIIPRKEQDGLFVVHEKLLEKDMIMKIRTALEPSITNAFGTHSGTVHSGNIAQEKHHPVEIESHERVFSRDPGLSTVESRGHDSEHDEVAEALGKKSTSKSHNTSSKPKKEVVKEVVKRVGSKKNTKKEKIVESEEEDTDEEDEEQVIPTSTSDKNNVSLDDIANLFK
ncbi:HIT family protein [Candidatus Woesearchaeota archaeon]|nr:HIT family protein [Candidatus Woesearchaeota archaeon]